VGGDKRTIAMTTIRIDPTQREHNDVITVLSSLSTIRESLRLRRWRRRIRKQPERSLNDWGLPGDGYW
jgi:hypothetical protein